MRILIALALLLLCGCSPSPPPRRVIVFGVDGCDPILLSRWMDQGKLPHFQRLKETGGYWTLATSNPAQSPVAWSTFITGQDPGGHGVFDFLRRDPQELTPASSLAAVEGGRTRLLRDGEPFWSYLIHKQVKCLLLKVPAHFPPPPDGSRLLSGLGTPDLLGSYGTFAFYTEGPDLPREAGGRIVRVESRQGKVRAALLGPQESSRDFTVWLEAAHQTALLEIGPERLLMKKGEWSPWTRVQFPQARGMVRFYLKSASPLQLYASPINLDPLAPAQPISSPDSFAAHLCHCCGPFYTQGMAEDSKALNSGVLTDAEYLQQSQLVLDESWRLLRLGLSEFKEGLFFFYLSSTDIQSHMFWDQPDIIEKAYRDADAMLGEILEHSGGDTTVFVLSDHGFAPFRRSFDLNAWLRQEELLHLVAPAAPSPRGRGTLEPERPLSSTDWSRTRAYGLGFNGLYLNLAGREAHGLVRPEEQEELLVDLTRRLLAVTDPANGGKVVLQVYRGQEINAGKHQAEAPDLVIGYQRGYRASWETALGQSGPAVLRDNREHWSGDHFMDPSVVPGVLLCSRRLRLPDPHLRDLAPTLLGRFGVAQPPSMKGRNLLEE